MVKISLALCALLGEDVAVISVLSLDLACAGESETLLSGGIGLYLWHGVFEKFSCFLHHLGT